MQRAEQFLAADRGGALLADGDAGGQVGEHGGVGQRRAGAQRHRERRDQRVAGAGDIGHLAGPRRQMQRRAAAAHQGQAPGRPGHQHRLAAGGIQRGAAGAIGLGVMLGVDAGGQPHLMLVRRQDGGAAIGREIGPFRIGDHQAVARRGARQHGGQHRVAQHALGIVGQHDDIGPVERRCEPLQHRRGGRSGQRFGGFFVEPQKLMRSGHEPGLGGGRPPGGDDKLAGDAVGRLHQAGHLGAGRIVADHADQHRLAAERRDIQCHVRRAAQRACDCRRGAAPGSAPRATGGARCRSHSGRG